MVFEGFRLFSFNASVNGCSQAVLTECEPILSEFKPNGRDILTECESRMAMFSSIRSDVLKRLHL
jgi:hypothetical protein